MSLIYFTEFIELIYSTRRLDSTSTITELITNSIAGDIDWYLSPHNTKRWKVNTTHPLHFQPLDILHLPGGGGRTAASPWNSGVFASWKRGMRMSTLWPRLAFINTITITIAHAPRIIIIASCAPEVRSKK